METNEHEENIVDRIEEKFLNGEDFNFMKKDIEELKALKGFNVYRWHCVYEIGEEILYVGAESTSEANKFIEEDLKNFNSNTGKVISFGKIGELKSLHKGIIKNY